MRYNYDMKRIGWMLFAFGVFVFVLFKTVENVEEHIELKNKDESDPMDAMVYEKTAQQDLLYGETYYYVLIAPGLTGQVVRELDVGQRAFVEKEEFEKLEIGDSVSGYRIDETFHNKDDLKDKDWSFYIGLAFASIYIIGYILYWLSKIKWVTAFFDRMERGKHSDRFLGIFLYGLLYGGLILGLSFCYYNMGLMVMNAYEKYSDANRIETMAMVTDHSLERNSSRYGDDGYYLALRFENHVNQTVYLTKKVTRDTYYTYQDQPVPISYNEENPYKVYLQEMSLEDYYQVFISNMMLLYYLVCFVTVLLVYAFICWRRYKRTGSYYRVKKENPPLSK